MERFWVVERDAIIKLKFDALVASICPEGGISDRDSVEYRQRDFVRDDIEG